MRIIIDFDDCICYGFPEFPQCIPGVVEKIRQLKSSSPETIITIHTARGGVSCGGDALLAEKKYRTGIESFLNENGIPYDELLFGKPFGDAYIDDKGISLREFLQPGSIQKFSGNSGAECYRIGDMFVKKYTGVKNSAKYERDWYSLFNKEYSGSKFRCPGVISYSYNTIHTRFVQGRTVYADGGLEAMILMMDFIESESYHDVGTENDVESFIDYINRKGEAFGVSLSKNETSLLRNNCERETFFHGDMTMLNAIISEDGVLYLIDPGYGRGVSNWMQDAGKLRASFSGLDDVLFGSEPNKRHLALQIFDERFGENIDVIRVLQRTHCIRVAHTCLLNGNCSKAKKVLELQYA